MAIEVIKSITSTGSYESKFGTMHAFRYSFESGMVGDASHKTESPPFRAGQSVEVTITGEFKGVSKIKVAKPEAGGAPSFQQPVATTIQSNVPATLVPGVSTTIHGATVGCALNNACIDFREAHTDKLDDHAFLAKWIWQRASVYLRASQALEMGRLWEDPTKAAAPVKAAPVAPQRAPARAPDNTEAFDSSGTPAADLPF